MVINDKLTGWWFGTWFLLSPIVGMLIQSDFHIFQGGRSTTNWNRFKDFKKN